MESEKFSLKQLQIEQKEWSDINFPMRYQNTWMPLMGLEEEVGELFESYNRDYAQYLDAIGDITVYLADYCTLNQIDLSTIIINIDLTKDQPRSVAEEMVALKIAVGRLDHFHLKGSQLIRYTAEQVVEGKLSQVTLIIYQLTLISHMIGRDYLTIVEEVWANVKKRNWKKNPINAHHEAEKEATPVAAGPEVQTANQVS